jgi:hypothetical protein
VLALAVHQQQATENLPVLGDLASYTEFNALDDLLTVTLQGRNTRLPDIKTGDGRIPLLSYGTETLPW